MKKALFLFILIIPFLSFSQPQLKGGHIFYQEAVDFSDISQEVAYVNTKKWFATTFNDSKEVIRLEDKETGIINWRCCYGRTIHASYLELEIRIKI